MYKIVFLLVFSVKVFADTASQSPLIVYADINFITNGGSSTLQCDITPPGIIQVSDGQEIKFYAKTPTEVHDFGCTNDDGTPVVFPSIKYERKDGTKRLWSLNKSIRYSQAEIGKYCLCFYKIKEPYETKVIAQKDSENHIHGNFKLQFQMIETPTVSLKIKQLNNNYMENLIQGSKKYNYTYTYEEEKQFDCVLNNPTENKEKYKISYYLDGKLKNTTTVTVNAHTKESLKYTFKLTKANQTIVCSAVDMGKRKGTKNPKIEINLHYIPPPPVFPVIRKPKVTPGKYFPENYTQIYYYNVTDEEDTKFECALSETEGYKSNIKMILYSEKESNGYEQANLVSKSFKLKGINKINCIAWDMKTQQHFYNIVNLNHNPASIDTPELTMTGQHGGKYFSANSKQMYNYTFSDREKVKISCNIGKADKYHLIFYFDGIEVKRSETEVTFIENMFYLEKDSKNISCVALDAASQRPLVSTLVQLQYSPPEHYDSSTKVDLSITGLPDSMCKTDSSGKSIDKICTYTFNEPELIGTTKRLDCTLNGGSYDYKITFGGEEKTAPKGTVTTISQEKTLEENNDSIKCKAIRKEHSGFSFSVVLHFIYIPPATPSTQQATPFTDKTAIQMSSPSVLESKNIESPAGKEWWLKFVLGGGAAIIALCVVVCVIIYYRKKKPQTDDLTYANLTKDQKNYATLPVPAPRTLQKDAKPKVTVEGTYSEPKDSQDMSEALYADPNRFNGSETYAEPYVKSGSNPCTYAEPNKADYAEPYMPKEGNYAAIGSQSEGGYAAIGKSEGEYAAIGNEGGYASIDNSEGGYAAIGNSEGGYAAIGNSEGGCAAIGKSEGSYAAIGNSEGNYAEIGAKSEGNYAEIGANNDNKELYAKPIPKAQRPFKAKDESDYSNVFKELYANAKKK
ncbi:uncharacterized protein LOC133533694 isoform X3 [Cydia pomonella]|uniref:uncharacterized protein LOC133533694 isoform X3 n=1 Tax=Cydia pomonella TaxID=82600 RepID=UPI002ADD386E|nr:uncharacterized protein LOC133533694 isoform X3 [Cydia pomonella]